MPVNPVRDNAIPPVPFEFGGKWIAWSADHSQIVAHNDRFEELWREIQRLQIDDAVFEKVPRSDTRFVGRQ